MTPATDAWDGADLVLDESACPTCLRENCEGCADGDAPVMPGLNPALLTDAVDVSAEGRAIAERGVPYLVADIIPAYGMAGFLIAYAKVGKTTFGQAMGAAVSKGEPFLDRVTQQARVLVIAAEDPPEYTAFVARHLNVPRGVMTFWRAPIILNDAGLATISATVAVGKYGFVLISSWQAVVRGLIADENDNAGAALVVENVKAAARQTGIPWLIDAHSGKGEDSGDDADPTRALRGASSAAGAADYLLSLRYASSPFKTQRRLSGKGRFVSVPALTLDFDPATSTYVPIGDTKQASVESTWQLICECGAVTDTPRSITEIARACGMLADDDKPSGGQRKQIAQALRARDSVGVVEETRRGQKTALYRRLGGAL